MKTNELEYILIKVTDLLSETSIASLKPWNTWDFRIRSIRQKQSGIDICYKKRYIWIVPWVAQWLKA